MKDVDRCMKDLVDGRVQGTFLSTVGGRCSDLLTALLGVYMSSWSIHRFVFSESINLFVSIISYIWWVSDISYE